jgi:hypothetical protein
MQQDIPSPLTGWQLREQTRLCGRSPPEAFDMYNHIDLKELKEDLAAIPQLGIRGVASFCSIA